MKRKRGRKKGYVVSDESKRKCSKTMTGRTLTEIHRKKISRSMLGNVNGYIHGFSYNCEYVIYHGMCSRCYNPNDGAYKNYGAHGVKVCDRWLNPITGFANFLNDMGSRPVSSSGSKRSEWSIERKNNEGDYEPSNCVWATMYTQMHNTKQVIRFIAKHQKRNLRIETKNIARFTREWGLAYICVKRCISGLQKTHRGWTFERV